MTTQQPIQVASWDLAAIMALMIPILILVMVMSIISKVVTRVTEPEFVKEVKPIAEEVMLARALRRG